MSSEPHLTKAKLLEFLGRMGASAEAIRPALLRYPAVDEESFLRRVKEFLGGRADV